jgi:hypothetical protein
MFVFQVPYNVPTSAYDLLLRLLRHESFVDEEAPLIRNKPDKMSKSSSSYDSSFMFSNAIAGPASQSGNPFPAIGSTMQQQGAAHSAHGFLPIGIALAVGFLMGAVFFRMRDGPRQQGYRTVPDIE